MILFEDGEEPASDSGRIAALEHRIVEMSGEVCGALGINAPGEDAVANWEAVLEAIRGRRVAVEPIGHMVVSAAGEPVYTEIFINIFRAHRTAEALGGMEGGPFCVVPVGPVVDLKPFGWGAVDETGLAMNQLVYRSREALDGRVPDGFAAVQLFYVPPPDRPAEAAEPKAPRTCDACGAPIQGGNCCAACHAAIEANRDRRLVDEARSALAKVEPQHSSGIPTPGEIMVLRELFRRGPDGIGATELSQALPSCREDTRMALLSLSSKGLVSVDVAKAPDIWALTPTGAAWAKAYESEQVETDRRRADRSAAIPKAGKP